MLKIALVLVTLFSAHQLFGSELIIETYSGKTYSDVTLDSLKNDSLCFAVANKNRVIPLSDIHRIVEERDSKAALGFLVGAGAGLLFVSQSDNGDKNSLFEPAEKMLDFLVVLSSALVGAIVGGAAGSDKKFDLAERDIEQCLSLIEKLINKAKKENRKKRLIPV
jgi:hypothetical protein